MESLQVKDLCFYGINASAERKIYGEKYIDLFLELSRFKMQDFFDGKRYLIRGNKGAGKSAILNYIYQSQKDNTKLIYFDQMTNEGTMGDFSRFQHIEYNTFYQRNTRPVSKAWELFIIKTIIYECYRDESIDLFKRDENFSKLYDILFAMYDKLDDFIVPKCRRGNFFAQTICNAFLETFPNAVDQIDNRRYIDEVIKKFYKLQINKNSKKFYILFDELNFTDDNPVEKNKQKNMIAQLILTINILHSKFKDYGLNVVIITSLRNEVQEVIGLELNKLLIDYGIEVNWNTVQEVESKNPLIRLMQKRFANSYADKKDISFEEIHSIWFPEFKTPEALAKNIIKHTWGKPRDIILIFTNLMKKYPKAVTINQKMLNNAYRDFAHDSWTEISESLKTIGSIDYKKIQTLIPNLPNKFVLNEFIEIFKSTLNEDELPKKEAFTYVNELFKCGILGVEISGKSYFSYNGFNNVINYSSLFVLHPTMKLGKKFI